ncbi:snf2 super family [Chrysochromulina tobinii]|uniref:Snf2 super family n=1 Tax=Chrysochromulina tobinii TaxID=1460289 RepID=A0A0M0JTW2_9EUKA|nr:snf2 super family [Chrysochromulina tobinii]|eukprot:KOO29940.1 snf2 super family [Chrysochromulina sp. CCMP291]
MPRKKRPIRSAEEEWEEEEEDDYEQYAAPRQGGSKKAVAAAASSSAAAGSLKRKGNQKKKKKEDEDAADAAMERPSNGLIHFQTHSKPPATISLATAEPIHLNADERESWASDKGGLRAARRGTEFDLFRLVGSLRIELTGTGLFDKGAPRKLGLLDKPVKPRETDAMWGWGHKIPGVKEAQSTAPTETWHKESGEVLGQGFVSANALLKALYEGEFMCTEEWAVELLEALGTLTAPDPKLRLLLYLIAHPSIRIILERLLPPHGAAPTPVDALPTYPASFLSHGGAAAPPFSLEGLLKATEHCGYRAHVQQEGLALTLKPYQQQAVAWMVDMEALPRGINGLFWEVRPFADGGAFYYSPQLGEMRLGAPPVMHGGLLCDEMGLGKTLEVVALVLATLAQPLEPTAEGCLPSRATLIVVPPTLVSQWLAEITKSVGAGSPLRVAKYTNADLISRDAAGLWRAAAAKLAEHDIVVSTYGALDKCTSALGAIAWRRVVLDEMQEVRSSTTELARKCERLHAPRRWMVSGTPLYDKIDDLQGELYFLRVSPFGAGHEDGFWRHVIGTPWEARQETALDALHVLLRGVMMRHAKSQTHIDGRSILSLPPKTLEYVAVQLAESELTSYAFLEALFVKEIRRCRALQSILMRGGVAVAAPPAVGLANNPFHRAGVHALSGAQLLVTALRLLREACVALPLLGGGAGCSDQLKQLEEICRARLRSMGAPDMHDMVQQAEEVCLQRMSASAAISALGSADRAHTEREHGDRFHNVSRQTDMVRHANQTNRVHDRSRAYAVDSLTTKLKETRTKLSELELTEVSSIKACAISRWRWALEQVTMGAVLCALRLRPEGEEDEEGALAGLQRAEAEAHEAAAAAEAEARAYAVEQADADAAASAAAKGSRRFVREGAAPKRKSEGVAPKRKSRTSAAGASVDGPLAGVSSFEHLSSASRTSAWHFVWLYRAAVAAHRRTTLEAAESALLEAEGRVRAPPLVPLPGAPPDRLVWVPCSRAEAEAGLVTLTKPMKPHASVTTEEEQKFNKELIRGKLRISGSEKLLSSVRWEHPEPFKRREEQLVNVLVLDTMDAEDPADGQFLKVLLAGAADHPTNWQWVLNKPRIDPYLLLLECKRRSIPPEDLLELRDDAAKRTQALKMCLSSEKEARDRARALCNSMAPRLATPVLHAFAQTAPIRALGGLAVLREPLEQLRAGVLTSFADLRGKVSAAIAVAVRRESVACGVGTEGLARQVAELGGEFRALAEAEGHRFAPIGWRPTARVLEALRTAHPEWAWLQPSALTFRGLPAGTTADDLIQALERFVHEEPSASSSSPSSSSAPEAVAPLAPSVSVRFSRTQTGVAVVDMGTESAARRVLEEAAKPHGLALPLERERAQWEEHLLGTARAAEVVRMEYESAKAAEAAAEAAVAAKRAQMGAKDSKGTRFEKTKEGKELLERRKEAAEMLTKSVGGVDSLTKRHHDAKRLLTTVQHGRRVFVRPESSAPARTMEASRTAEILFIRRAFGADAGLVTVDKSASIRREERAFEPQRDAAAAGVNGDASSAGGVRAKFSSDYCAELLEALGRADDTKALTRLQLSELRPYAAKLQTAHERGLDADVVEQAGFQELFNLERGVPLTATCPICFDIVGAEGGGIVVTPCAHLYCRDCMVKWFAADDVLRSAAERQGASLSHKLCPCCRAPFSMKMLIEPLSTIKPSAKLKRLLADLEALGVDENGVPLKAVVFSQHRAAIKHADLVLAHAGVPHVTISKGDAQASLESAVATWQQRPTCRIFLLHAGAAAAGLTLVAARHVFLLEPFDKPGQELQALNRCHRIGQTRPVRCTIYYAQRTVEERLIAFRTHEQRRQPEVHAELAQGGEAEAITTLAEGAALPSRQKLRFLFGMLRQAHAHAAADAGEDDEDEDEEAEEG